MKMKLVRRIGHEQVEQQKEDEHKMSNDSENNGWEDMVQYSLDENGLKEVNSEGDKNMKVVNGNGGLSNEELEEMERMKVIAMEKMGNLDLVKKDNSDSKDSNEDSGKDNGNQEDKGVNNVNNVVNMSMMPSLSNKTRMEGEDKETEEPIFIFENCVQIPKGDGTFKYQTLASAATIGKLWDDLILEYQGNLQRGYKLNTKGEEVAIYSQKHVKEILESALTQKLNGGVITLNILDTVPINFDKENRTISIAPNQKLQILDGQHRIRSFSFWNRKFLKSPSSCISPEEFFMPILIEHASENNAKLIFSEYATKFLRISNSRSLFLDVDSNINKIARKIMNESLSTKVEVVSNTIKKNSGKIITFSVLTKGVSAFKPATPKECDVIGNFLCLYWSELIELFPKLMGDVSSEIRNSERAKSFANESMFQIAYHYLAKILIDDKDWKGKLKRLTMDNFLSRDNELWIKNITRNQGKIVNTSSTQSFVTQNIIDWCTKDVEKK